MTRQRKPGGGRRPLSDEPTVKLEIMLPQSQKIALVACAQLRSTQQQREVTVSQLMRDAIPDIISGISREDVAEMEVSRSAMTRMAADNEGDSTMTYNIQYHAIDGSDGGTIKSGFATIEEAKAWAADNTPPDAVVIIQGDSEGNSFSPIAGVDHDALSYEPDTPVRGDVVPGDGGVKCVVLYPKA